MKAHRLYLAAVAGVAVVAVLMLITPPDAAAVMALLAQPHGHAIEASTLLATALATLRTQHADLVRQAETLESSIREGMPEADVTRIRGEHEALVSQAEGVQTEITAAEAAERGGPQQQQPGNAAAPPTADEAVRAERQRVATIRDIGTRAGLEATAIQTAIDDGTVVDAFRTRAFDTLAARSRQNPTQSVNASITRDEVDTRRAAMRGALIARLARAGGERNVQIPEASRAYGEMGFAEMAAECIGHRGHLRTPRQVIEVFERAFHSTSDFPGIFSDALNSRLLARYQVAMPTYRLVCAPYTAVDFRAINIVRAGDFPAPQLIPETGEIPASTFGESKEQLTVHPYGVRFNISRQMIVNDNLGAINQLLGSYGDTILRWENGIFTALLISNSHAGPTLLTDSTALFATGHGNHVTSGTAIAVASVGAGRAAMMKQTSLDGQALNIMPSVLLCGPDRLTDAEQLVATINPALIASAQPDWIKRLMPAGDAGVDGNHWYLFASPSVAPAFVYGMLQGFEGPRLSTDDPFTVQGVSVKLEHDFGVAGIDYRGAYHNAGAAPT
jgi:hypothetical protein